MKFKTLFKSISKDYMWIDLGNKTYLLNLAINTDIILSIQNSTGYTVVEEFYHYVMVNRTVLKEHSFEFNLFLTEGKYTSLGEAYDVSFSNPEVKEKLNIAPTPEQEFYLAKMNEAKEGISSLEADYRINKYKAVELDSLRRHVLACKELREKKAKLQEEVVIMSSKIRSLDETTEMIRKRAEKVLETFSIKAFQKEKAKKSKAKQR